MSTKPGAIQIKRQIFSKTGEAFLDLSIQEDVIYSEFDFVGRMLCQKYIEGDSSFYLLDSVQVQAAAVHGHQAVLVCKGMLDLIFRTSAMMVGAERRQKSPEDEFYEPWINNLSYCLRALNSIGRMKGIGGFIRTIIGKLSKCLPKAYLYSLCCMK